MQNKTILITGATGYLGNYLSRNFLAQGKFNIIALRLNKNDKFLCDPCYTYPRIKTYCLDETDLETIFQENKIDIIIHTAVLYGRSNEAIESMINVNVSFPLKILALAEKYKIDLFINTDSILAPNINAYAMTKHNFADWLSLFKDSFKIVNMRLDHFFGPNDKPIKFIAWLIYQMKNNVDKIDLTDGSQTRDFIYIDDVVSAYNTIVLNINKFSKSQINTFEVGTNIKTSVKDMVLLIYNKIKPKNTVLNFGAIPYRKNEMLDYDINTTPLRLLGWEPKVTVDKGIETILKTEGIIQ